MATFTMELYKVRELRPDLTGEVVGTGIGLGGYPIFDHEHRAVLNDKIIQHYLNREIGYESVDMFVHALTRRMNEVMPIYNELYKLASKDIDWLATTDVTTEIDGSAEQSATGAATGTSVTDSDSRSRAVTSNTPQVALSGNGDYASALTDSNGQSGSTGETNENSESLSESSNRSISHTRGYSGVTAADLISKFRREMLNIDVLIIDDLADLFMGVWDNGDNYNPYSFTPLTII